VTRATILVVEDSPTHLRLTAEPLRAQGYRVLTAADGEEALARVAEERPDLVLLDVVLPGANGFQVCRQLKNDPGAWPVKVLMVTGKKMDSDRWWGLRQGADDYLTKPFADEELLARVALLLGAGGREG
jgi:twitching motility two-component system response regulator PilH